MHRFTNTALAQRMQHSLSIKHEISTVPCLKYRIFCRIRTSLGGTVGKRWRKEAVVGDGGLQPKDKNERRPEVAEGTTSGWRGFSSDAAAEGKLLQGRSQAGSCPDSRPDALREARRAVTPAGSVLGSPWPPVAQRRRCLLPAGLRPCTCPARGVSPQEPALFPPPRPPAGVLPPRNSKREQLEPANPQGGSPPGTAPAAPPGSASPAGTATHPVWRAGWTCTRRRRGWRR